MGAYLSAPVTDKISCDKSCTEFTYGASSMQGWRINQEDAHNCIPDFDPESRTSLFAVYDGHGGSEVAQYCSQYLPDCIKETEQYKEGELGSALVDAFLKFDSTLVQDDIIKELKQLAGVDENDEEEEDEDPVGRGEAEDLRAEADLPLDELLAKYKTPPGSAAVKNVRKKENFQSPIVRAKKNTPDSDAGPSSSGDAGRSLCTNGSSLANGVADNENNQNKEKELQDSAMSSSSHPEAGDSVLTEQSNSSGKASSSNHASSSDRACVGESGDGVSSTGYGDGEGCGEKGEVRGGEGSSSGSSGQASSKSSAPSSDVVSSSSSVTDDGPSASGSGSSAAGSSSGAAGSSSSAAGGSSSSSRGSNSGSKSGKGGPQADEEDMDNDDDSDDEDDEEEWQDIESGEEEEEDEEEEENMEDSPMVDMSNEEPGSDSGCTACVVLLRDERLVVANSGDSRCVLCRGGTALDLSTDHKPEDDTERLRIENAGGRVTADGRVNGGLNLSRAIGDHFYKRKEDLPPEKQMITALPDIQVACVDPMDQFFVVACDGIWNSMSSQDCVDFIAERLKDPAKKSKPSLICEELFDHCLAENTYGDGTGCDNMTCIIVVLHPQDQQLSENGLLPSKRCVRELETPEENLEKRPRVEEEVEGEETVEGKETGTSSQ